MITPAEGLAFFISAIIELLLLVKLFSSFFLKSINELFLLIISYYNKQITKNFEDKFEDHEKYEEMYDTEFTELYEIIYRDFSDIDFDTNIIYPKIVDNITNKNDINFLVCERFRFFFQNFTHFCLLNL